MAWDSKKIAAPKEEQQKRRTKIPHPHIAGHIKDIRKSVPYHERYYGPLEAPEGKGTGDDKGNVVPILETEKSEAENQIPLTEDTPKIHKKSYEVNVESKQVQGFVKIMQRAFRELFPK